MIQRIQSVYLLITAILMSLLVFLPLSDFIYPIDGESIGVNKLYIWGILESSTGIIIPIWYASILLGLTIVVPIMTIFIYKKRWLQIRLCAVQIILLLGTQIYIVMYIIKLIKITKEIDPINVPIFSWTDFIPVVCIILTILALKGIFKDETLIKSLNRIR